MEENVLREPAAKSALVSFLEQLKEPLMLILLAATGISFFLGEAGDGFIILAVITINSIIGVIQEGKTKKALAALKKLASPTALVKKGRLVEEIPAADLRPGDVVVLETGRQVPADGKIMVSNSLKLEESALTGESVPVEKEKGEQVFMSTNVVYGRGEAMITAIGMHTEIGKIAELINTTKEEATPLQKRLADLGKLLSVVAVLLCALFFVLSLLQKRDLAEMLITAISLAVAAVPEGLPATVTIVLALSVSRMVKINTIVRRLPSVETLGAVTVVCSDKTGTLTQNKMTVMDCFVNGRQQKAEELNVNEHRELLEGILLCNDAVISDKQTLGDPTEIGLMELSMHYGLKRNELELRLPRRGEIPFDSDRKRMTTFHSTGGNGVSYTKGAGEVVLALCTHILMKHQVVLLSEKHRNDIRRGMREMTGKALRVLALAQKYPAEKPVEEGLTFVGLVGLMDPVRPEAEHAIELFKKASVKTVMITGDHIDTAAAIARQLRITASREECIRGTDLNNLSDAELSDKIETLRVFAGVSPEHKVRIVKAFQAKNNIVAMTGDGVNDAPSLKAADIGIAMGKNGTDVAKNAADMVLTDDNFATIERAIEEGRCIYANIKKTVVFLLSSNFGEMITMLFAVIAGLPTPLKASHILWINLITDSLPALALGVDDNDREHLMSKPPRHAGESLFSNGGLFLTLFYGVLIAFISLTAFFTIPFVNLFGGAGISIAGILEILKVPGVLEKSQTYAFTVLGISQLFHAIGMRDTEQSVFKRRQKKNLLMLAAIMIGLLLQAGVTEVPLLVSAFDTVKLSLMEWAGLLLLSLVPLVVHEILALK